MPPRKKRNTTKSKSSKVSQLPPSSPGDEQTRECHQMLVREMLSTRGRSQTSNDAIQSPVGSQPTSHLVKPASSSQPTNHHFEPNFRSQPTNHLIEPVSSSQPTNHLIEPVSSSQPTNHLIEPTSSPQPINNYNSHLSTSKIANPRPSLSETKQPTTDLRVEIGDTPPRNLQSSKKRRRSPTSIQTSSPTIQDDDDDSWLGRPIPTQQATANPLRNTFEITNIRFLQSEREIQAKVYWGNRTSEWLDVESMWEWAEDQLCAAFYKKLLELAGFEESKTEDEESSETEDEEESEIENENE